MGAVGGESVRAHGGNLGSVRGSGTWWRLWVMGLGVMGISGDGLMGDLEVVRQLWGLSGASGSVGGSLGSRDSRVGGSLEVLEGFCV